MTKTSTPSTISGRHAELVRQIREHDYRYYVEDSPSISDREYDRSVFEYLFIDFSQGAGCRRSLR